MDLNNKAKLLRKDGKSFREIAKILNIPLSTSHLWARNIKLTKEQKQKLKQKSLIVLQKSRIKAQKSKKKKYLQEVRENYRIGVDLIGNSITFRESILIGASLYWAEGFRRDNRLGFANSDPMMIKFILFWLINIFKVNKNSIRLRVGINVSFKDKITKIEEYWSEETGIPLNQFNKPFFQNTNLKRNYSNREEYYGVLRIRAIGQNKSFRKILGMIDGLKKTILKLS